MRAFDSTTAIAASFIVAIAIAAMGSAHAANPLSPEKEATAEQIEAACKLTAHERSLTGKALNQAVQACVASDAPSLAFWEKCRTKARKSHLSGVAMSDDVNFCMSQEP